MATRQEIVDEARTWLGTPWRHQGRVGPEGQRTVIDCAGLVEAVGNATGASAYHGPTDYRRESDGARFLQHFSRAGCREKPTTEARPGDILVFKVRGAVYSRHCGIRSDLDGRPHVVHALATAPWRRVVELPLDETWRAVLVTCFEFPAVEERA